MALRVAGPAVKKLALLLVSLAVCAIALEIGLAFARINTRSFTRFVAGKGTTRIPNAYYRWTAEGGSEGYFNSHGFRDLERTYDKPAGVFRILVLGDSYVEAFQVPLEDGFPRRLEKLLNAQASGGRRYEVISLGQAGFGTAEEYLRYVNFGTQYSADLVLLAFLTYNDFQDNSKYLSGESNEFYFLFDQNRQLVEDRSFLESYERSLTFGKRAFHWLKEKSYLASLISERIYLLRFQASNPRWQATPEEEPGTPAQPATLGEFSDLNIYAPHPSERWRDAFELTGKIILKLRDAAAQQGSRFAVVSLSNADQVEPDRQERLNRRFGMLDYEQPDRIVEQLAATNDIPFLKLAPIILAHRLATGEHPHGFDERHEGHWNSSGHKLAAEAIATFLRAANLLGDQTEAQAQR